MINFDNVSVQYEKVTALRNISFQIEKGDFVYVVGPNGSGKTTLVKVLAGLLKPTSGIIDISDNRMGYLPQKMNSGAGFPISVKEVIYSGFIKQKLKMSKIDEDIVRDWLERMEISHLMYKQISALSGGEQQRVYLIRALVSNPDVLILDEPTSALDPVFRERFYQSLNEFYRFGAKTIIYVTHELKLLSDIDTQTLFIDQEIKYFGPSKAYLESVNGVHHV
jgi:zinc transport system ATP-binding protein